MGLIKVIAGNNNFWLNIKKMLISGLIWVIPQLVIFAMNQMGDLKNMTVGAAISLIAVGIIDWIKHYGGVVASKKVAK